MSFSSFYRSIKHYFLLDKGDFIVQFMDMTEQEMKQDIDNILVWHSQLPSVYQSCSMIRNQISVACHFMVILDLQSVYILHYNLFLSCFPVTR